jgi:hypothetical protein
VLQLSWEPVFVVQEMARPALRLVQAGSGAAWALRLLAEVRERSRSAQRRQTCIVQHRPFR